MTEMEDDQNQKFKIGESKGHRQFGQFGLGVKY